MNYLQQSENLANLPRHQALAYLQIGVYNQYLDFVECLQSANQEGAVQAKVGFYASVKRLTDCFPMLAKGTTIKLMKDDVGKGRGDTAKTIRTLLDYLTSSDELNH